VQGVSPSATPFSPACGPTPTQQANWEIAITNADGAQLPPGATWSNIQSALNLANYSNFSPGTADWFSPCLTGASYAPSAQFAVYFQGNLVFSNGIDAPHGTQRLAGYLPPTGSRVLGPMPSNTEVALAVVLPLRDPAGLDAFIHQVSDPASPMYRHYKSIGDFASAYGMLPSDYAQVQAWASSFGTVTTYPNNLLIDVVASAEQIESALFLNLVVAERADGTQFYEPDRIPTFNLPASISLDAISGIDDFFQPRPLGGGTSPLPPAFQGSDLRAAYLGTTGSCAQLTGQGQSIGLVEFDGYTQASGGTSGDIEAYEANTGLKNVPAVVPVLLNKVSGQPSGGGGSTECAADIEMAIAMAPGATVIPFEGARFESILGAMATTPGLNQISSSWGHPLTATAQRFINEFAAQGQSFFQSSGDNGAYDPNAQTCNCPCAGGTVSFTVCPGTCTSVCAGIPPTKACSDIDTSATLDGTPTDTRAYDNITLVGGTILSTGTDEAWARETTWPGSGGGVIANLPLPVYQQGLPNLLSTTNRNSPDVSFAATNLYLVSTGCSGSFANGKCSGSLTPRTPSLGFSGTSFSAPLWAAFMALVNENGAAENGPIGFANPLLYTIGKDPARYSQAFHDINDMSTDANQCGGTSVAKTGYDLATGWGAPSCGLIAQAQVRPTITVGVTNPTNAGPVVCLSGKGFTPGGTATIQLTGVPENDDRQGQPTTQVITTNLETGSGQVQFIYNRQADLERVITGGVADCTAARQSTGSVSVQAIDNTTGVTASINVPASFWCGIGPLTFGEGCPTIQVNYHQIGACNGFASDPKTNAGPMAAYVVFGFENIVSEASTPYTIAPTKIFVQRGPLQNFFDPSLSIYADLFGPFALIDTLVAPGQDLRFGVGVPGGTIVDTLTQNGAQEADMTGYFLNYSPFVSDPAVDFVKSNASQFVYPLTEDCGAIVLR
jgi:hypothetical protein